MTDSRGYSKSLQRGKRLLAVLDNPETTQSKWMSHASLEDNTWAMRKSTFSADSGMSRLFNDLSLPDLVAGDDNQALTISHGPRKESHYRQTFNIKGGTIFARSLKSPKANAGSDEETMRNLPDLQHWSDVTFLMWQKFSDPISLKGLKRIVHCGIHNPDTENTIEKVIGSSKANYPGHIYTRADGDNFAALLRTPNGLGTAYLVAQHRDQLGEKKVQSIQAYEEALGGEDGECYFMVLSIG